ncbi:MAG: hypothetical protein ACRCTZ_06810 [Sarcina sp.]
MQPVIEYFYGIVNLEEILDETKIQGEYFGNITKNIKDSPIYMGYLEHTGNYIAIPLHLPFEKPIFESKEACDEYIRGIIKPYLRAGVTDSDYQIAEYADYDLM